MVCIGCLAVLRLWVNRKSVSRNRGLKIMDWSAESIGGRLDTSASGSSSWISCFTMAGGISFSESDRASAGGEELFDAVPGEIELAKGGESFHLGETRLFLRQCRDLRLFRNQFLMTRGGLFRISAMFSITRRFGYWLCISKISFRAAISSSSNFVLCPDIFWFAKTYSSNIYMRESAREHTVARQVRRSQRGATSEHELMSYDYAEMIW